MIKHIILGIPKIDELGFPVTGFGSFKLNPLGPVLLTISHAVEVGGVWL